MMKLALGTVQFGLDYGVTNVQGRVEKEEVKRILSTIGKNEIRYLDTASAYGESETVLGELASKNFEIITKIPPLEKPSLDSIHKSFNDSLKKLNRTKITGVMLHREDDFFIEGVYNKLLMLKDEGLVDKIGCSFYSPLALEKALDGNLKLDIIQIPANCLDNRFEKNKLLETAKNEGIEVYARSLFLQGLLLDREVTLPASVVKFAPELVKYFEFCETHLLSPLEMALAYVIKNEFIDYAVVGCVSERQINDIISSYKKISSLDLDFNFDSVVSSSEVLVNPSLWK